MRAIPFLLLPISLAACDRAPTGDMAAEVAARDNAAAQVEIEKMKAEIAVIEAQARASALANELAARDAAAAMTIGDEINMIAPPPPTTLPPDPNARDVDTARVATSPDDIDAAAARVQAEMERRRQQR